MNLVDNATLTPHGHAGEADARRELLTAGSIVSGLTATALATVLIGTNANQFLISNAVYTGNAAAVGTFDLASSDSYLLTSNLIQSGVALSTGERRSLSLGCMIVQCTSSACRPCAASSTHDGISACLMVDTQRQLMKSFDSTPVKCMPACHLRCRHSRGRRGEHQRSQQHKVRWTREQPDLGDVL